MRLVFLISALLIALPDAAFASDPKFINRAKSMNVEHVYAGGWEHFVGGGIAVFDCNADGYPEIFLSGGSNQDTLLLNTTNSSKSSLSYKPLPITNERGTIGAYPLDLDSDGWMDLFILRVGKNKILKGGSDCQFTDDNKALGFSDDGMWSTAFSASWEKGAVFPTLAVGNYVDRDHADAPFGTCEDNYLYRPISGSYAKPITLTPGFCSLSMLFSDWGRKGRQDLRVSNDRHYYVRGGTEQLWRMDENLSLYTQAEGWTPYSIWGMGIASRDISGDGVPEVYLTSMGDQKLQFLGSKTKPTFNNAPYEYGVTAHRPFIGGDGRPSTGWHAQFGDMNNDGMADLFVTKGNVDQMPDAATADPNNLLMATELGKFVEKGSEAGVASLHRSRGGAVVDLNLDGLLDIVVINRRENVEILENKTEVTGNFLSVQLAQEGANLNAVGAWIEVKDGARIWSREVTVGGGHAGGQAGFHHFGLGHATNIKLRVIWPHSDPSEWIQVRTNQHIQIKRSENKLIMTTLNY